MRNLVAWALAIGVVLALGPAPAFADRLPTTVTPEHYDLAFDVDLARARFEGTETIRVTLAEPSTRIVLHAVEITFHDVRISAGGVVQTAKVTFDGANQTAVLTVSKPLPIGSGELRMRYTGILNNELRGLYLSKANGRSYAVSQLESTDARRMFPSFDEPIYKATFDVRATIDRRDTAISNGRLVSDTPGPGASKHTLRFATSPRMSSYLVALAVGDFACLDGAADGIPLRVCATPDRQALGAFALESAEYVLHYYNTYYAIKYPFEKLDMVAVPDFAAGAMENTAAIFYRDTDLLVDASHASVGALKNVASTVAHEMAHQWFGDLVTMRWWDDLWLNEGFATWMESRPLTAWKPEWHMDVDQALDTQRALNLDSLKSTHPIHSTVETPAEIDESFDLIAYEKGAAVVRMIENYVGADTFRNGVNAYLAAHAYGNATSEDFAAAIAAASGKPVDTILPTFVNQPGVPLVSVSATCGATAGPNPGWGWSREQQRFFVDSDAANSASNAPWQIPICAKEPGRGSASCQVLEGPDEATTIRDAACPAWLMANAGAYGYYRTAYSPELLRSLSANGQTALSAPERVSLVGDEWALVQAGHDSVANFLNLAAGFGREPIRGVLDEITSGLAFMHTYLTTAATRAPYEAFVRGLFRPQFADMGISASAADADDRRELRAVIVETLGTAGNDPDVIAQARAALDNALAGRAALDPTAAGAIVTVAASHGDRALWDALLAAAKRATSPGEQYRYLYALGDFADPALIRAGLDEVLSPDVRTQNAGRYLSGFLRNPAANQMAWTFLKDHWKDLEPKLSVAFADVGVVQALGSFCDAASRDDVQTFFATHKLGNAARSVDQTIERINNCIARREKQAPVLAEWLRGQDRSAVLSGPR